MLKFKKDYGKVIDELKQLHSKELVSRSELILVDKPKCGYFKSYEISVDKYKDPDRLFRDKKSCYHKTNCKRIKRAWSIEIPAKPHHRIL